MATDYIAIVWDGPSALPSGSAAPFIDAMRDGDDEWKEVFNSIGIAVFARCTADYTTCFQVLPGHIGVLFGTIFLKGMKNEARPVVLDEYSTKQIEATDGRALLESYWGRYVAFLVDSRTVTQRVIRDPTGAVECFTCSSGTIQLFFSSMRSCPALQVLHFSINFGFVANYLACFPQSTCETGINEITRVANGQCVQIHARSTYRVLYWDPVHFAVDDEIKDIVDASFVLRDVTRACVRTWAAYFGKILVLLSGGIDSSVLLSCLQDSGNCRVHCLNYSYTNDHRTDERKFARLSAARSGFPLTEVESAESVMLPQALARVPHPTPYGAPIGAPIAAFRRKLAMEHGASAFFFGVGGDELFCDGDPLLALADFLKTRGLRRTLLMKGAEAARAYHISIGRALWRGARIGLLRQSASVLPKHREEMNALLDDHAIDLLATHQSPLHPWLNAHTNMPPGKLLQLFGITLTDAAPRPDALTGDPEEVRPLLSQPLIEISLRIPVYSHMVGGMGRGLARRSFVDDVPDEVLTRRDKGSTGDVVTRLIRENKSYVRELLLDGPISKLRLLNRDAVTRALEKDVIGVNRVLVLRAIITAGWLTDWI